MKKRSGKPRSQARAPRAAPKVRKPAAAQGIETAATPAVEPTPRLTVKLVAEPAPYAEVSIREPVTEASVERLFEQARVELLRQRPRRVLVDMSDARVDLSISDLNGLVKMIAASFAGNVERLGIVMRSADVPEEKFLEPSLSHRGLPTYVTVDVPDAIDWLTSKQRLR